MYHLTIDQSGQFISAIGEERCVNLISRSPVAVRSGDWAFIPSQRANFFAVEALGSPEVSDTYRVAREAAVREPVEDLTATASYLKTVGWTDQLKDYQVEFVSFARRLRKVLNFSEPGTGKTRMNLALASVTNWRLCLIIGPSAAAGEWTREYGKTLGDRFDFELYVPPGANTNARADKIIDSIPIGKRTMVYISFESFSRCYEKFLEVDGIMMIVDESWKVKEHNSKSSIAVRRVAEVASIVTLNSGTIIGNEVGDLWNPLACVQCPGLEDFSLFRQQHCEFVISQNGPRPFAKPVGAKDPVGLMQMASHVWFRVVKSACMDLPQPELEIVKLDMPRETRQWYKMVEDHGETALGFDLSLAGEGTSLLRKQQISGGFLPLESEYAASLGVELSQIVDEDSGIVQGESRLYPLPCSKLDWIKDRALSSWLGDPTLRVLIWSRYTAEIMRITAMLKEYFGDRVVAVTGATKNIEEIKDSYNSKTPEGIQIMVCQVAKMAFSHNLAATSEDITFSNTWSFIEKDQARERGQRPDRVGTLRRFELTYRNSIDEIILRTLDRKENLDDQLSIATA